MRRIIVPPPDRRRDIVTDPDGGGSITPTPVECDSTDATVPQPLCRPRGRTQKGTWTIDLRCRYDRESIVAMRTRIVGDAPECDRDALDSLLAERWDGQ